MADLAWLGQEAKSLHDIFGGLFYGVVTMLLLLGVFVEYFKWPLGEMPGFSVLVGRALVAAILFHSYSEATNALADFSDALSLRLGDLNEFKLVLSRMGDKLGEFSASWVSVKEGLTMALSFVGFFALYFSVYVAEGVHLFTWTICYVFSPFLIALYVHPSTSGATKGLYRTLIEISCWKVVWSVLATLLWSTALSDLNKPGQDVNFISVICLDLLLASSLLATPWVVHSLATSGMAGFTRSLGAIAVGAATITPGRVLSTAKNTAMRAGGATHRGISRLRSQEKSAAQGGSGGEE